MSADEILSRILKQQEDILIRISQIEEKVKEAEEKQGQSMELQKQIQEHIETFQTIMDQKDNRTRAILTRIEKGKK